MTVMESYQVLEWGRPLQHVLADAPRPQGSEVLVRVTACGVCHSDVHIRDGAYDMGHGTSIRLGEIGIHLPLTMGHEIVGVVESCGPDASIEAGTPGVVYPWIGCGVCRRCLTGNELDCETPRSLGTRRAGGYANFVLVPHPRYVLPYDGIDPLVAASAACSGLTAFSALKKLPACTREDVIVLIGAGGLGSAALGLMRVMSPARVVVVDADPAKLDRIRTQADAVIDINSEDGRARLRELAGGGASGVIDFVGVPQTFEWGLAALRKGGTLVEVGLFGGGISLSLPLLPMKNLRLMGSYVGSLEEFKELLGLLRTGRVKTVPLTERPIAEINEVLSDLRAGRVAGRVMAIP